MSPPSIFSYACDRTGSDRPILIRCRTCADTLEGCVIRVEWTSSTSSFASMASITRCRHASALLNMTSDDAHVLPHLVHALLTVATGCCPSATTY